MYKKINKKSIDILLFSVYPLIAALISFKLNVNAFFSTIVFYGIPAVYLSFKKPAFIKKALLFSTISIPAIIVIDYIAEVSGAWLIPRSLLPKLFGYVPIEVISWAFLHLLAVVMFYEYFFDKRTRSKLFYPREKLLFLPILFIFSLFLSLLFFTEKIFIVPYWYLIFGLLLIVPPILFEEYRYPKVFLKLVKASTYFIYLNFIYELTAIKLGWWSFPGTQYIGWISFSNISFPFEEFFFWIILFTLAVLSLYEYFFDREV